MESEKTLIDLVKSKTIHLDLSNHNLNEGLIMDICEIIKQENYQLESICLTHKSLSPLMMAHLIPVLERKSQLKKITLDYTNLDDERIYSISELLVKNRNIRYLSLVGNCFTQKGINYLAQAMHKVPNGLVSLDLSNNKNNIQNITCLGTAIASHLTLKEIKLNNMDISDKNISEFFMIIKFNSSLSFISVIDNDIGKKSIESFFEFAESHPSLTSFNLSFNKFSKNDYKELEKLLEKNKNIIEINLPSQAKNKRKIENLLNNNLEEIKLYYDLVGNPQQIKEEVRKNSLSHFLFRKFYPYKDPKRNNQISFLSKAVKNKWTLIVPNEEGQTPLDLIKKNNIVLLDEFAFSQRGEDFHFLYSLLQKDIKINHSDGKIELTCENSEKLNYLKRLFGRFFSELKSEDGLLVLEKNFFLSIVNCQNIFYYYAFKSRQDKKFEDACFFLEHAIALEPDKIDFHQEKDNINYKKLSNNNNDGDSEKREIKNKSPYFFKKNFPQELNREIFLKFYLVDALWRKGLIIEDQDFLDISFNNDYDLNIISSNKELIKKLSSEWFSSGKSYIGSDGRIYLVIKPDQVINFLKEYCAIPIQMIAFYYAEHIKKMNHHYYCHIEIREKYILIGTTFNRQEMQKLSIHNCIQKKLFPQHVDPVIKEIMLQLIKIYCQKVDYYFYKPNLPFLIKEKTLTKKDIEEKRYQDFVANFFCEDECAQTTTKKSDVNAIIDLFHKTLNQEIYRDWTIKKQKEKLVILMNQYLNEDNNSDKLKSLRYWIFCQLAMSAWKEGNFYLCDILLTVIEKIPGLFNCLSLESKKILEYLFDIFKPEKTERLLFEMIYHFDKFGCIHPILKVLENKNVEEKLNAIINFKNSYLQSDRSCFPFNLVDLLSLKCIHQTDKKNIFTVKKIIQKLEENYSILFDLKILFKNLQCFEKKDLSLSMVEPIKNTILTYSEEKILFSMMFQDGDIFYPSFLPNVLVWCIQNIDVLAEKGIDGFECIEIILKYRLVSLREDDTFIINEVLGKASFENVDKIDDILNKYTQKISTPLSDSNTSLSFPMTLFGSSNSGLNDLKQEKTLSLRN